MLELLWDVVYRFIYGVFPYVAVIVFVAGTVWRFRTDQFHWRSKSSQLLRRKQLIVGSVLFHVGVIVILIGHLLGFFTPHAVLEAAGVSAAEHLMVSLVVGGPAGLVCFIGLTMLLHRRLFDPRIRKTSSKMDIYIAIHLYVQVILGLATIPVSLQHLDGAQQARFASYMQHTATFQADALSYLEGLHWIPMIHLFTGLLLIFMIPFTRLVHMFSAPLSFIGRSYIVVRSKIGSRAA